ncbi:small, acid-soluble spore protein, alpha/beta type [Dethiobacter alkaliphilus]|uniref:Small, acid-soluble spore protein, alpha/beta family n=1 Tax=Dethiobacter alkaliphilus AHT 1 TaxID=555088 RepID=C0GKM1_DETAL|nr:small, acid-soluble spore protein, alpha/beta type [Dethiobacter alkaliphilus]EEG76113.1 small, acid-soluble spore protein, alpha/beta family [Dethiobacter alkaliphilus AHT 1]MCW3489619.1 alpha/beta-type small acid-soluble spore protein [Dethiobacter alkaliphilus]
MAKYKKKPEKMTPEELAVEKMKLEIADELGLGDKVKEKGWENLTARETGRVGGVMSRRLRDKKLQKS